MTQQTSNQRPRHAVIHKTTNSKKQTPVSMLTYTYPRNIFSDLAESLGKEHAEKLVSGFEQAIKEQNSQLQQQLESGRKEQTLQIKSELKAELEKDLSKLMASKQDIYETKLEINNLKTELHEQGASIRTEITSVRTEIANLKADIKVKFYMLIALMVVLNPTAIDLIGKIIGLAK